MVTRPAAYGLSDVGRTRGHNEDAFLADDALGLFVVADGMGGAAAGEVASAMAIHAVRDHIAAHADVLKQLAEAPTPEHRAAAEGLVQAAIQDACAQIYAASKKDRTRRGMGTTIDCVLVAGGAALVGHVGDSRVYLLRQGRANRLTEDHTLVAMQLKAGLITKEQAAVSDWRSVLTNSLGPQPSVQPDTLFLECAPGDRLLLCSDGLHGPVGDDEIAALAGQCGPDELPRRLVDLANERGGPDNVTALVVSFPAEATATSPANDAATMMDILRRVPLFATLSYKEQAAVVAVARAYRYQPGHVVVKEGQPAEEFFVVLRGRVAVEKAGIAIGNLGEGDPFGEMGLVDDAPRSATVRAVEPTRVMVISRDDMMVLMRREPRLAVKLLWTMVQTLAGRLRDASHEIVTVKQELAAERGEGPFIVVED